MKWRSKDEILAAYREAGESVTHNMKQEQATAKKERRKGGGNAR